MDTISLKQYIYENNKIPFVLDKIGCSHIQYHPLKEYYSCSNYNGDNQSAVNVFNSPYLGVRNWTREKDFPDHSDIYTLVGYNKKFGFVETIKYIHSILGLEYKWSKPRKKVDVEDPLYIFKKHRLGICDVKEYEILQSDLIDHYVPVLNESWFREGIIQKTRDKFDICYSFKRKRIVLPLKMWNTGELLGFNARTTIQNYEELGIKKYFITPSYPKRLNLYGLYENMEGIRENKRILLVESEKSVLKRDSRNDPTAVALSGHTISEEQVSILKGIMAESGSELIVSLDNDIPIEEVRFICSKFYGWRVSYTIDKWNLLGKTDSIVDCNNKTFDFFIRHRIQYDDYEHQKFLDSINR